jgi:serine/threonine protein kinase
MNPMQSTILPLGSQLQEYRIDAVMGVGTFGITYKATDTNLGIIVVIKEYLPLSYAKRSSENLVHAISEQTREIFEWGRERFLDEAKVLAKFRHPNIVRVLRYFKENDTAYIVMEFEDGESLQRKLSLSSEPYTEAQIKHIFSQVLEGLKTVHEQKYLHRDIKPGNIYIRDDNTAILIDFGAARLEMPGEGSATITVSPGYAPVEQYVPDGKQGPWSDIYAIGASIYRCITKKTPTLSIERMKTIDEEGYDPCLRLAELSPQLGSREFLESVDRMLSVIPEDRPQSVSEVLDAWAGRKPLPKPGDRKKSYTPKQVKKTYKILIASSDGGDKSTAIRSISDTNVENSAAGAQVSDSSALPAAPMDYGSLDISDCERILVYGIPGNERFRFIWDILQKGAIGLVLLIDNESQNPLTDLETYLTMFESFIDRTGVVIGINRTRHRHPDIHEYHEYLQKTPYAGKSRPPILEVDPTNKSDMKKLLLSLIFHIDPGVEELNV